MTELCRFSLLLFTLLLYIFWLPSANVNEVTPAEDLIISLLREYISSGCKGAKAAAGASLSDADAIKNDPHCSFGEKYIVSMLSDYLFSDCEDFETEGADDPRLYTGQRHIIDLLSSYFSSGCKAAVDAVVITQSPAYSAGERQIIKLLSPYFSSPECKEPLSADHRGKPTNDQGPVVQSRDNSSNPNPGSSAKPRSRADVHHVQLLLEFSLLICGVYFTWG